VGAGTLNLAAWASPQIAADSVLFADTPGLGSPLPHPHRDWAHPPHLRWDWAHPATSAPGLGSLLPHLHRDWAHPCHIGTGAGLTPPPHLHRDLGRRSRRTGRRRRSVQSVQRKEPCRLNRCAPHRQQANARACTRATCVHATPCRRATDRAARPRDSVAALPPLRCCSTVLRPFGLVCPAARDRCVDTK
jgi:hypothetical protein